MRGKQSAYELFPSPTRIIPAHAGQTTKAARDLAKTPDHPRACGANATGSPDYTEGDGSSPRMRGKPHHFPSFQLA